MYSFTEENYLKAIYKLELEFGAVIHTNAIAGTTQTKAASVTDMIKRLSEKGLLEYEKYKGVNLTSKGRKVAVDTIRKHRLWETFLHNKLQFSWDEVHDIAEQLEHIQSNELIDKLDSFLGFPSHDPHGDPIPGKDGEIRGVSFLGLNQLEPGDKAYISGVVNHSPQFLQHLQKNHLILGKVIYIKEISAFDQSFTIELEDIGIQLLSKEVVQNILVTKITV